MSNARIGDLVRARGQWVLVLEQNIYAARGFAVGSVDPTAMVEVAHRDLTAAIAGTSRTREIADRILTIGHRPSELPAVNAELAAVVAPAR